MLEAIRRRIPAVVKAPLRQFVDSLNDTKRKRQLRAHVRQLQANAEARLPVSEKTLSACRKAWGNEAWSADLSFVKEVASHSENSAMNFLDCGSGLSTVVAGVLTSANGGHIWSLEQDGSWANYMSDLLAFLDVQNVTLIHAPLREFEDFVWYDVRSDDLPESFQTIFVDGPAVLPESCSDPFYSNWRAGVVPVLKSMNKPFEEIVLDDASDHRCEQLMRTWQAAGIDTHVVETPTGPFVRCQVRVNTDD
jgi:hypothetical protein